LVTEQLLGRVALPENDITGLEAAHRGACTGQDAEIDGRISRKHCASLTVPE
jgi:hypothetical protein